MSNYYTGDRCPDCNAPLMADDRGREGYFIACPDVGCGWELPEYKAVQQGYAADPEEDSVIGPMTIENPDGRDYEVGVTLRKNRTVIHDLHPNTESKVILELGAMVDERHIKEVVRAYYKGRSQGIKVGMRAKENQIKRNLGIDS